MQNILSHLPDKIILASASPRRRQLLEEIGLFVDVKTTDIDETSHRGLPPAELACHLAKKKAETIAWQFPGALVIGADTVVVLDDHIMGKPDDTGDARNMLKKLSGRSHQVITGVSLIYNESKSVFFESTEVTFKKMIDAEIDWYIQTGEPMDKAGAYGIQGRGRIFISSLNGCYFNVVGFPVHRFYEILFELFGDKI